MESLSNVENGFIIGVMGLGSFESNFMFVLECSDFPLMLEFGFEVERYLRTFF